MGMFPGALFGPQVDLLLVVFQYYHRRNREVLALLVFLRLVLDPHLKFEGYETQSICVDTMNNNNIRNS
jgi:hypothetical protein